MLECKANTWFGYDPDVSTAELLLSLEKLVQVFNLSPELMSITTLDEGIYIDVNQTLLETLGCQREQVIGQSVTQIGIWATPEDREQALAELLGNNGKVRGREITFLRGQGQLGTGLWSADIIMIGGEKCILASLLDITDRKQMEEALRKSEQLFRLLAENARDIIYRISLRPRHVEYISPSIRSITGYTPEDHYNNPWLIFDIIHPEDRHILMKPASSYNEEPIIIRWITRDGKIIWTEQRNRIIFDAQQRPIAIEGISRDITERVLLEENLRHTSLHDTLTSLYNRAYFEEELRRLDNNREHTGVAIIACDVDGLKLVNDVMGHAEGDRIIKMAATVLEESLRQGDVLARVGGDEFAVIVAPATKTLAQELRSRIVAEVDLYNRTNPGVPLGLSVGYAIRSGKMSLDEVYRDADSDMYRHKMRHRKQYRYQLLRSMARQAEITVYNQELDTHIQRIKMAVSLLGKQLKLSRKRIDTLVRLAEFHDIGAVSIPIDILTKPGELSAAEWNLVKQHPENGFRIANMVPELNQLADTIISHHERWDGSGYPYGLEGNKIPLESRILAIADAFSAMTCVRSYRAAISEAAALAELEKGVGSQFDPDLVARFVDSYRQSASDTDL